MPRVLKRVRVTRRLSLTALLCDATSLSGATPARNGEAAAPPRRRGGGRRKQRLDLRGRRHDPRGVRACSFTADRLSLRRPAALAAAVRRAPAAVGRNVYASDAKG